MLINWIRFDNFFNRWNWNWSININITNNFFDNWYDSFNRYCKRLWNFDNSFDWIRFFNSSNNFIWYFDNFFNRNWNLFFEKYKYEILKFTSILFYHTGCGTLTILSTICSTGTSLTTIRSTGYGAGTSFSIGCGTGTIRSTG